jgi:hypothetical protein
MDDPRRLVDKLIRAMSRCEIQATEHAPRESRRIGHAPPVLALRDVARHAHAMRPRFLAMIAGHDLVPTRSGFGSTLATLRHLVVDHVIDAERSFRTALLDLRHAIDVGAMLRELSYREQLFGLVRWSDDWLEVRRVLVARVEAQLAWYVEQPPAPARSEDVSEPSDEPPGFLDWL